MKIIYSKSELRHMEEILRRNASQYFNGKESLYTTESIIKYLEAILSNRRDAEYIGCIFMNNLHFLLGIEILAKGNSNYVQINPRQIVEKCIALDASDIILFHNHPDGNGKPSQSDIDNINNMKKILHVLDIELIDGIVIGNPDCSASLKDKGLLEEILEE